MGMKNKLFLMTELAIVLLITGTAFTWAKNLALTERGYTAYGGEYMLFLLPILYYTLKSMRW